jgi:hypothetical protein
MSVEFIYMGSIALFCGIVKNYSVGSSGFSGDSSSPSKSSSSMATYSER